MKKIVSAALALFGAAALFADSPEGTKGVYFSNTLSSDLIRAWSFEGRDNVAKFGGFVDVVEAGYVSDLVRVGVKGVLLFAPTAELAKDHNDYDLDWNSFWATRDRSDFFVEINPWDGLLGFGFHDNLYTKGSLLPVLGESVGAGNYSTSGVSALLRPLEALTIGAGLDEGAHFGDDDGKRDWAIAVGADFSTDLFTVGGSLRHIGTDRDNFQFGVYGSVSPFDALTVNAGFTHSEAADAGIGHVDYIHSNDIYDTVRRLPGAAWARNVDGIYGIFGKDILTAGATFGFDEMSFGADFAVNFDTDKSVYDLYLGALFRAEIVDGVAFEAKGFALFDLDGSEIYKSNGEKRGLDPTLGVWPRIVYTYQKKHELSAGIKLQKCFDSDCGYGFFALPISWKYTL